MLFSLHTPPHQAKAFCDNKSGQTFLPDEEKTSHYQSWQQRHLEENMWHDTLPSCMHPDKLNAIIFMLVVGCIFCRNSNKTTNESNCAPAVSTSCSISFENEKWRPSSKLYWCPREYGYYVRGGGSGCYGNTRPQLNGAVRVSNAMLLVKTLNHYPNAQLYKHPN